MYRPVNIFDALFFVFYEKSADECVRILQNTAQFFQKKLEKKRQMKYNSIENIFGEINESNRLD